ncbi:PaaI family thioesterase [Nocardia noduli]|uniref:PaaI family thioesterase n=1 Tax=Nocardia noduli TaxID=2815722 RepID=UPI001C22DE7B|nr:PaaI family thioesterase [Nocardia noduli]
MPRGSEETLYCCFYRIGLQFRLGELYSCRRKDAPQEKESALNGIAYLETIGIREVPSDEDRSVIELEITDELLNPHGGLQGGLIATLIDVAAGRAASKSIPADSSVVTSDVSIRYLRPVTGGSAQAVARILRAGRRSVAVGVEVLAHPTGELAAVATLGLVVVERS